MNRSKAKVLNSIILEESERREGGTERDRERERDGWTADRQRNRRTKTCRQK